MFYSKLNRSRLKKRLLILIEVGLFQVGINLDTTICALLPRHNKAAELKFSIRTKVKVHKAGKRWYK
jgi:hypothetical protein